MKPTALSAAESDVCESVNALPMALAECFACAKLSAMELTVTQAAEVAGLTARVLQQATASGVLPVQRVAGRTQLIDSAVLQAYLRLSRSGRRWDGRTAKAALDLLDAGETRALSGSELSRLRARLRRISAADIAHRLGATANWYRYRSVNHTRDEVARQVRPTGPTLLEDPRLADRLGLLPGGSDSLYGVVNDLSLVEAESGLILDGEGDIFITERIRNGVGAGLVDLFLFGDARESAAAATELERRAAAC